MGGTFSPFTARSFDQLRTAKFIAVFGNNEGEKIMVQSTIEGFGGEIYDDCFKGVIEDKDKRIFMTHTQAYLDEIVNSRIYDLVIYGHTHKPDIRRVDKTLVINPGETTDWITGAPQIVILELDSMDYQIIPLK